MATASDPPETLAVVMACHNRREQTLTCLAALRTAAQQTGIAYTLYLFDDGSSDGTAAAVQAAEPQAVVLHGDGSHFWNRGMHAAFAHAMQRGHRGYLWLNDDTRLRPHGLQHLLETLAAAPRAIVVGAVQDPRTGCRSYGGSRRIDPRWRPFRAQAVEPDGRPARVDMMNGNVVLVPHGVAERVGNLDPVFEHAMGDTDYALRARRAGIAILQTGRYVGECSRNPLRGTLRDRDAPLRRRFADALSRKGLPPRSWFVLCKRHGGVLWPIHFTWAYTKVLLGRSW